MILTFRLIGFTAYNFIYQLSIFNPLLPAPCHQILSLSYLIVLETVKIQASVY